MADIEDQEDDNGPGLSSQETAPIFGDEAANNVELDEDLSEDDIEKIREVMDINTSTDENKDFYHNLAENIPYGLQNKLEMYLREIINQDEDDNTKTIEKYTEALKRTGLGDDAPGGAAFSGASKVVHPLLSEASIDFQANTMKALIPASGPVRAHIDDDYTDERKAQALRIEKKLNKQLMSECSEYVPNMDKLLSQVPLNGEQYLKISWDFRHKRPKFDYVPSDYIMLPGTAIDFYTADRFTHRQNLTPVEYDYRVTNGLYNDPENRHMFSIVEQTGPEMANQKISGITNSSEDQNIDDVLTVDETHIMINWGMFGDEFDNFDKEAKHDYIPYVITRTAEDGKILSIYRNWMQDDESQERMEWVVPFQFIPWRGPKAVGLIQLIGSLAIAATGSLRALLDSAMIQNMPGMIKMKGGRLSGQNIDLSPTTINEISSEGNVDDIRKLIMAMPFNPPSDVLFKLLGTVLEEARGVVRTSMDNIAETNANTPVGTTLAQIEQGMKVYSSIYMRMHRSQQRVIDILCRLNSQYLEVELKPGEDEMNLARPSDFKLGEDIVPVSDPNMYSDVQRIAQAQSVTQLAAQAPPGLYDLRAVHENMLNAMRVPNIDELMPTPTDQKNENPVTENVKMGMVQPAFALPDQDHMAHLKVHIDWYRNPLFGANPMFKQSVPLIYDHVKQHMLLFYASEMQKLASEELGKPVNELVKGKLAEDNGVMNGLSQLLAHASQEVNPMVDRSLNQIANDIEKMSQVVQTMQPPMPMDPSQAALQAAQMQAQVKTQEIQANSQAKQADTQVKAQDNQTKAQLAQAEMQNEETIAQQKNMTELKKNEEDNTTAMIISRENNIAGHISNFKDGNGIGE